MPLAEDHVQVSAVTVTEIGFMGILSFAFPDSSTWQPD